jgi:hypothetical protein
MATTSNQVDRGAELMPRRIVDYWCAADHRTSAPFATDVEPPDVWSCRVCSGSSVQERGSAQVEIRPRFFPRTPYEFLMMRRTVEDGERILAEALTAMRQGRYRSKSGASRVDNPTRKSGV